VKHWFDPLRHPAARLVALALLVIVIPMVARSLLGWSDPFGYVSDLAIGIGLILVLQRQRPWLALGALVAWALLNVAAVELVSAVGRLPASSDLAYVFDTQFVANSTGGGLAHPALPWALALGIVLWLLTCRLSRRHTSVRLPRRAWSVPALLLVVHWAGQHLAPSEADPWRQFNLPHQLLAAGTGAVQQQVERWAGLEPQAAPPSMTGLVGIDLDGQRLLNGPGQARNLLIVTLEGIPGAYVRANRQALDSPFDEDLMPRLSRWAERGMNTPDYVLHTHQTIRGLYAMLCGDYDKFDNGTPKGVELLNQQTRNQACLPAQLRRHGFTTHYLQGAGLRFMAKDRIMPHIGFQAVHGMEWFANDNYLTFPWGKDDKAFFEGAAQYVDQLRQQREPWMLTLLTVGTHQPYSAPEAYLARYPSAKQAAVAYLDDALGDFLETLERQGVLEDTLVIVTSDESHGIDGVRLASAWGFNLMLAPDQARLPHLKSGTYGHVDLTASLLDYFALPVPAELNGRSLLRDYASGRPMLSFTNGQLRHHDGHGTLTECDFQQRCRRYASEGFIASAARYLGQGDRSTAQQVTAMAGALDRSLMSTPLNVRYQFGSAAPVPLNPSVRDDWVDNLIGAQYLEMPEGSRTRVRLKIRSLALDTPAQILLKAKEFEQDVALGLPDVMTVSAEQPLVMEFDFDNPMARKAFSFHLLGYGTGAVEISDFSVITALPGDADPYSDEEHPPA